MPEALISPFVDFLSLNFLAKCVNLGISDYATNHPYLKSPLRLPL